MVMAEKTVVEKTEKPEEALRQQPQAREPVADMMAKLRDAKITKISQPEPALSQATRERMIQGLCSDFFGACMEKAMKSGTADELKKSEMNRFFG